MTHRPDASGAPDDGPIRPAPERAVKGASARRRSLATRVGRALSPRGALALQSVDGAVSFALRAALAMAVPALPLALAGRADHAVYTMLGSFITTFGRNLPYARRARVLAVVAVAMTATVACGSALAVGAQPRDGGAGAAVTVVAMALVAAAAKFACDAARLSGLGAVLLLFAFAVAANGSTDPADVLAQTALAATGATVAWVLAVLGWFVHPDRPQRLAVAAALRELADLWEAAGRGEGRGLLRHRATAAVLQAYRTLGVMPPTGAERDGRGDICLRLTDLAWVLLIGSARRAHDDPHGPARHLRRQAALLVSRRRRPPRMLPEPAVLSRTLTVPPAAARSEATPPASAPDSATLRAAEARATELVTGRGHGSAARTAVLTVPALRMFLGTGLAGAAALPLGLGHGYWAAISAAAVLHSVNVRTAAQRAVQRTLGTMAGLLLALGVLAARPEPVVLVLVIVVMEFLLEYVVARNYGLGVVFLTPLALLLTDLAAPSPAGDLVQDRALGSLLGVGIALVCALLVVHDRAAVRARRALAACRAASGHAERVLDGRSAAPFPAAQAQLAAAVVELRTAADAAAGELWSAEIDPTELAAAERRAYLLLERFARPPA
ncbi:FUSC family protein [Streptomyces sp. ATCC51928]|uniref:FUSC family protein n=1 Tax=Streptomyces caviscabies TaxID=90079 RepID=A0ABW2MKA6_9ACTN|nr:MULTISPECIES: FUSC family protein [unclassified Streptomyces]MCL6290555.1 FUSC family protein [Streptomyces sp. 43Y-GA-1]MDX3343211.1 FUSC family protein [Streptomyces sp. ME02-6979.5a]MDX3504825.1 FUSC family protein [Streptomyces sp. ATCC51928]MDX5524499.1 FUSC family protein [Streptomyces sp. DE06-01C]